MNTIDITPFAPAAADINPRLQQKRSRAELTAPDGMKVTMDLGVYYDKTPGAYRAYLVRTVTTLNPETGRPAFVMDGPRGTGRVDLFAIRGEWSLELLDTLYSQAFEAVVSRLAVGDQKVTAILAALED